jgi:hypothetical protein
VICYCGWPAVHETSWLASTKLTDHKVIGGDPKDSAIHADHGAVPSLMGPSTRAPVTGRGEGDRSSQLQAKETGIGIRQESVRRPLHQTA